MTVSRGTFRRACDVLIVGAGHAGVEAALACARLGLETALFTIRRDGIAQMSCNPAIGGLGKSQIVREIDALGGEMAHLADAAAIHYRRLNGSRGPAVRARRVQADMPIYQRTATETLETCKSLVVLEGVVNEVLTSSNGVIGIALEDGSRFRARAVVITTGTFLNGLIHVGEESFSGGRFGDPAATGLSDCLVRLGLELGRLKTGTPARLDSATVNFTNLEVQPSDEVQHPFSHEGPGFVLPQVACHGTRTTIETHEIIQKGLSRSPLFTGVIKGRGPRYCPSIEDKVVRFSDRTSHKVVLEPTDHTCRVLYPNGISTSLPRDVQENFIHSIPGLEKVQVLQHGYAIEYDFVLPTQLRPSLEVKTVPGLFLAGQINGTSGYEEAAGQGLLAGINAANFVRGQKPVILGRHEAYIGVMIDDLVTRGTSEPYRMFSSRAEFRLLLREDNAATRLQDLAERIGLVAEEDLRLRRKIQQQVQEVVSELRKTRYLHSGNDRRPTLEKVLRRPEVRIETLAGMLPTRLPLDVLEQAEVEVKYKGYIDREFIEVEKLSQLEMRKLPEEMDYLSIPGLSKELSNKLQTIQPVTFGQASRVDGMTPAALLVLSVWLKRNPRVPRGTTPGENNDGGNP